MKLNKLQLIIIWLLTTFFALSALILLVIVLDQKGIINFSMLRATVTPTQPVATPSASVAKTTTIRISGSEGLYTEFYIPTEWNAVIEDTKNGKIIKYGDYTLTITVSEDEYPDHQSRVGTSMEAVNVIDQYYRVLQKTENNFDYFFYGQELESYYEYSCSGINKKCYINYFMHSMHELSLALKISLKVPHNTNAEILNKFDTVIATAKDFGTVTKKYRGGLKDFNKYMYDYLGEDYYVFSELESTESTEMQVVGSVYLIKKSDADSLYRFKPSDIGKSFELTGRASLLTEDVIAFYNFYKISSIIIK